MNTIIEFEGQLAKELRLFLEDQKTQKNSPYRSIVTKEKGRNVGTGKEAGLMEVLVLVLIIGQDLLKNLVIDFIKEKIKGGNHAARYKIRNEEGNELEITLNRLKLEDVREIITNFKGNLVDIRSQDDKRL